MIVAVLIAVGLAVGAVFYLRPPALFGAPYLGSWELDRDRSVETLVDSQAKASGRTLSDPERKMAEAIGFSLLSTMELRVTFRDDTVDSYTKGPDGKPLEAQETYTSVAQSDGSHRLTITGETTSTVTIRILDRNSFEVSGLVKERQHVALIFKRTS